MLKKGVEHVLRYRDENVKLSEDQKHIINLASCQISCIKDGSGLKNFPQLVLCQGPAGSGKTLIISELECMITEAFGNDSALIIAFTGSSALNANGRTIHSALRLQFDNKSKDVVDLKGDTLRDFQEKMINVKFLIIEEFSMVGCRLFNIINRRCMQMKSNTEPFGGLPVYMFGDLFQLPPVGDTRLYSLNIEKYKTIAYSGSILFKSMVDTKFLRSCHRQGDKEFLSFLENLSTGIVTNIGQRYISDRFEENMSTEEIETFQDAVHLFQHVKATENCNKQKLLELGKPINNNSYAKCSSDDLACNLQNSLQIAIGARVMLRSNLWTEGGLVNGCIGYVQDVLYCQEIDEDCPSIIMVKFDSYYGPTLPNGCVPITRIMKSWTVNNIYCTRYQFPLTLAYAITIHKCQGLTLRKCVIHIDCAEIMSGIFYVAMSRVREKCDLMISGNFINSPLFKISQDKYKAEIKGKKWLLERTPCQGPASPSLGIFPTFFKQNFLKVSLSSKCPVQTLTLPANKIHLKNKIGKKSSKLSSTSLEADQKRMRTQHSSSSPDEPTTSSSWQNTASSYSPKERESSRHNSPEASRNHQEGQHETNDLENSSDSDSESQNHILQVSNNFLPSTPQAMISSSQQERSGSNSTPQHTERHEPETTPASSQPNPVQEANQQNPAPQAEGGNARERFNNRNQQVVPLRKCSELVPGRRYQIINLSRTNTQYGSAIRALISDDRSPTGRSFIYLPVRFRSMSDEDLNELNIQANSTEGLHIVYNGRVGRADMVELKTYLNHRVRLLFIRDFHHHQNYSVNSTWLLVVDHSQVKF
ncbi:ATP-dependent DNA helicase [Frankliniella fusca]|uniref:ATP-dependent DNA helicase n=1 Tax=Frankliniella fusca TaxID=407009 RepID=A0AAE1HHK0_9NEOP|nr:ATP-dependent DNA helicase [Frankliniella fusca]